MKTKTRNRYLLICNETCTSIVWKMCSLLENISKITFDKRTVTQNSIVNTLQMTFYIKKTKM